MEAIEAMNVYMVTSENRFSHIKLSGWVMKKKIVVAMVLNYVPIYY